MVMLRPGQQQDAAGVPYDNTSSGLTATDLQAATDEVEGRIDTLESGPPSHAGTHQHSGSDEVATATPGANAIPKSGAGGTFADGWIAESSVTQHEAAIDHDALTNFAIGEHRVINDSGSSTTELWSASKIDAVTSAISAGIDLKPGVDTTTEGEGDITLSGEQTLNGLLTSSSRVLVTDQTDASENGIYASASGAWSRAADSDEDAEVTNGNTVHVLNSGSDKFKYKYILITPDPITVGTTDQDWEEHKDIDFGTTAGTATEGNDTRVPTQDENDALQGTDGTPSNSNRYVTNSDARNTNARTPTAHDLAGAEHNASTLAQLNAKVSDATLIDTNDSRLSDDRTADAIRTATTEVSVSGAAAPSADQVLTAINSTSANWKTPAPGVSLGKKAGAVAAGSFSGNPKTAAVVFTTPYSDSNYSITTEEISTGSGFSTRIIAKSSTGFTISMGTNNLGNLIEVTWMTMAYGEEG